jgi:hypothetical protein
METHIVLIVLAVVIIVLTSIALSKIQKVLDNSNSVLITQNDYTAFFGLEHLDFTVNAGSSQSLSFTVPKGSCLTGIKYTPLSNTVAGGVSNNITVKVGTTENNNDVNGAINLTTDVFSSYVNSYSQDFGVIENLGCSNVDKTLFLTITNGRTAQVSLSVQLLFDTLYNYLN